jgi:hypothetical protein
VSKPNYRQIYAIEKKNKERLLKLNPKLNDKSGIYFFLRTDENGFKFAYIGQAINIIQRCSGHLNGYQQHIDLSIRKHGLYDSEKNPYGWKLEFLNFPKDQLDEKEKFYIKQYADNGYQLRNVSLGGQGENRSSGQINEQRASKGYRDGLKQGEKNLAKELSNIIDKHLVVTLKPEKANNKVSQKQFEKFKELLKVGDNNEQ